MTDQLISFETAKLAKEKGFNIQTRPFYVEGRIFDFTPIHEDVQSADNAHWCPTQSLLQKWLREKYHIIVEPRFIGGKTTATAWYDYVIYMPDEYTTEYVWSLDSDLKMTYKTYEEALEQGLVEALKIINQ
jgi:hypothetical protein